MFKKCLSALLVFVMLASSAVFADTLTDAQNRKAEAEKKMNAAKDAKEQEQERINYMEAELEIIENELNTINANLETATANLNQTTKELEQQEKDLEAYNVAYGKRLKVLYEEGSVGYLEVILNSKSFSDFLERCEIVKSLAEYDNQILDQMEQKKNEIAATKTKIEGEKAQIETQKTEQQTKMEQKDAVKKQHEALRNDYAAAESEAKAQVEKEEKAIAEAQAEIQRKMQEAAKASQNKGNGSNGGGSTTYSSGALRAPINGGLTVTCPYGMRVHPVTGQYKMHTGVDLAASRGNPVFAAADGTVITSGYNAAYGNYVVINHGGGMATLYAHHTANLVSVGASVKKGQQIATIGSTGYSTGPHCHFEVIINDQTQNPMNYIR